MTQDSSSTTQDYLHIGEIYREHGVKGFCKVYIYSHGDDSLELGHTYRLARVDGEVLETKLLKISSVGRYFLLHFSAFNSPEQVQAWRKAGVWVKKAELEKSPHEMYDYEWIGFTVHDATAHEIGVITSVSYTPLKQFIVRRSTEHEILIPYQAEWIFKIDRRKKTVTLDLPEGLLEL